MPVVSSQQICNSTFPFCIQHPNQGNTLFAYFRGCRTELKRLSVTSKLRYSLQSTD